MEDRYEIRGKIGQGGLGAVYRGYDTRMNREVAIKRISVNENDAELMDESTRQLIKEAGALASLQHPHIVTIYDVGADEDGPYVVMELISGKTLDEIIEEALFTWEDFRELALQTQEALIAAQALELIHSDIKPSNLMLTWLPSGKFQMKIVDFGLATLTHSQSLEELQELEMVFGSIFFMAPEQFERVPIDTRTDMYAMGCVYYQALTGIYPFQGETAQDVMKSHLHHKVTPIQDVRAGIPIWVCEWIMWHINRHASDRPESARQALQVFLQNDKWPNPPLSLGKVVKAGPVAPKTRLIVPGAGAAPAPANQRAGAPTRTSAAAKPLLPPVGSQPSIYNAPIEQVENEPIAVIAATTAPIRAASVPTRNYQAAQIKSPPPTKKIAAIIAASVVLLAVGVFLTMRIKASVDSQRYGKLLIAADGGAKQISISRAELERMLDDAANANTDAKQQKFFKALAIAKANDKSDMNSIIIGFTTKSTQLLPEVREAMINSVVAKRINASNVPALVDFARNTPDAKSAAAAYRAIQPYAGDDQFEALLSVAQFGSRPELKKAAEECATAVMKRSTNKGKLSAMVTAAMGLTSNKDTKASLARIQSAK